MNLLLHIKIKVSNPIIPQEAETKCDVNKKWMSERKKSKPRVYFNKSSKAKIENEGKKNYAFLNFKGENIRKEKLKFNNQWIFNLTPHK